MSASAVLCVQRCPRHEEVTCHSRVLRPTSGGGRKLLLHFMTCFRREERESTNGPAFCCFLKYQGAILREARQTPPLGCTALNVSVLFRPHSGHWLLCAGAATIPPSSPKFFPSCITKASPPSRQQLPVLLPAPRALICLHRATGAGLRPSRPPRQEQMGAKDGSLS